MQVLENHRLAGAVRPMNSTAAGTDDTALVRTCTHTHTHTHTHGGPLLRQCTSHTLKRGGQLHVTGLSDVCQPMCAAYVCHVCLCVCVIQEVDFLKRYIHYCRSQCSPRLSEGAQERLAAYYVEVREEVRDLCVCVCVCVCSKYHYLHTSYMCGSACSTHDVCAGVPKSACVYVCVSQARKAAERDDTDVPPVPVTVRQLEALIRISESLAKMGLQVGLQCAHTHTHTQAYKTHTLTGPSGPHAEQSQHQRRLTMATRRRSVWAGVWV